VHPFDEVEWETRDAVIPNFKQGGNAFEQRDVEFPKSWSQNATNIVAQKYFRGPLGTPQRESSVRQLAGRVVDTIRGWGLKDGYFKSERDANVFADELTHLVVTQKAAFNSPVWFNVGVPNTPQQCSACFILAVDDTMSSILNWYVEEGTIFKGGSGSGINLSKIRSSKEPLAGGGTASGPVSFMRGADASAGTIKSGGKTRRAAKMVVLNVDHPDVHDFIWCKAVEEHKARALRDAGFDMDLDGKDSYSIQYQNANNSVRVTDEFMHAYENDRDWRLKAVLTAETVETVRARELMREVAQAAWECADPGMQYDTTINEWHTCPASGRINASNPCFTGDSRVHTDKGLIRFDDLARRVTAGETFDVYTHDITNADRPRDSIRLSRPTQFMINDVKEIVRLRFSDGRQIRCTPNHRFWTKNRGWVRADELTEADEIPALDHATASTMADHGLPVSNDWRSYATRGDWSKELQLPQKWDEELAHYLGWLIGDGSISGNVVTTVYGSTEDQEEILPRHLELLTRINGSRAPKPSAQENGTVQLRLSRRPLARFFESLGVKPGRAATKEVPWSIFEAPEEIQRAFLRGLFDADGCVVELQNGTRYVGLGSRSSELLRGTQMLLASLGVRSRTYDVSGKSPRRSFEYTRKGDGTTVTYASAGPSFDLRMFGENVLLFLGVVGFSLARKEMKLASLVQNHSRYRPGRGSRLVAREADGFEQTFNLTEPINHSYIVDGCVVANCSEYMHLDNSACNLASLNLLKFVDDDGTFDVVAFKHAVEVVFTAQEIVVGNSDYPTEAIGRNAKAFRQLGLGYANLGALLMARGLPYDSDAGRAWAGAITALMTGWAYRTSARIAEVTGPFAGFPPNRDAMLRVMRKHRSAAADEVDGELVPEGLLSASKQAWDEAIALGEKHGYRNAQASVLAPTGTIGLMMDCDTTGIEPDLALVKNKKLVGGGTMQIVNQTVPRALEKLGYTQPQIEDVVGYIAEHNSVADAPHLREEHYPVFDTSMGERAIQYMGHVRMMAAVQPFISGAISKTVNMPEQVTVEEVEQLFVESWKLGLKAVAIYRDNCKVAQPLSADKKAKVAKLAELAEPERKRLPRSRPSITTKFEVGDAEGYITASSYPDDGIGEIFLKTSKQGSTLAGIMDAFSIAISIGLQYGVPLEAFVSKFINTKFEPSGMTNDPDIRFATSLVDYVFRRLALDHLPKDKREELGIRTIAERKEMAANGNGYGYAAASEPAPQTPVSSEATDVKAEAEAPGRPIELTEKPRTQAADAPLCYACGSKMQPSGSCYVCPSCGSTSGCS
jgi:ribonucleoside-diphosphate reductase alpha chain